MRNNNEVERARAWFEQLEPHEWSAVCKRVFGYVDFVLSTEKLLQAYNAEHPESKEPQKQQGCPFDEEAFNPDSGAERSHTNSPALGKRSTEQTYSIEEAVQWLKDGNAIENDCDDLDLLSRILKVAFPNANDWDTDGSSKYYLYSPGYEWDGLQHNPTGRSIKLSQIKDSKTADITPNKRYDSDLVKEVEDCRGVDAYEEGVSLSGFISQNIQLAWKPKEDITAYELAMCLPILIHGHIYTELPDDPHFRHFEVNKQPTY